LGGVVEVALTDAQVAQNSTLNAGYGHTGDYALSGQSSLSLSALKGRVLLRGGGGYRESSGFPLPAAVREPAPFADRDLRLNSDRLQRDGFLSARYMSSGGAWLSVSSFGYSATRGTPAELNTTAARFWRYPEQRRVIGSTSIGSGQRAAPWGGKARIEGSFGYDAGHTELTSYKDRTYTTLTDSELDDDRNLTARVLAVQTVTTKGEISGALTYADVRREETVATTSTLVQRLKPGGASRSATVRACACMAVMRTTPRTHLPPRTSLPSNQWMCAVRASVLPVPAARADCSCTAALVAAHVSLPCASCIPAR
jgi:hypothetical protein